MDGRFKAKHGQSRSALYKLWLNIKDRCGNPRCPQFHNYGGRGIRMCEAWKNFLAFQEAVGPRPSPQHKIDRINNDGNYEPGNVRWATQKEQCRNLRKNRMLTFRGVKKPLAAWAEEIGLVPSTLHYRLSKRGGMTVEQALTTPRREGRRPMG